jgi:hypothetical protein
MTSRLHHSICLLWHRSRWDHHFQVRIQYCSPASRQLGWCLHHSSSVSIVTMDYLTGR